MVTELVVTVAVPQLSVAVTVGADNSDTDVHVAVVLAGTPTNTGAVLSVTVIVWLDVEELPH